METTEKQHDGNLGDDGHSVFYDTYWGVSGVCVKGTYWGPIGTAFLHPQEALSLLEWLRQEEEHLRSAAKEGSD